MHSKLSSTLLSCLEVSMASLEQVSDLFTKRNTVNKLIYWPPFCPTTTIVTDW